VQRQDEHLAAVPQAQQEGEHAAVTQSGAVQQGQPDERIGVLDFGLCESCCRGGRGDDGRDDQGGGPAEDGTLGHGEHEEGDGAGDQRGGPAVSAVPRMAGARAAAARPTGTLTRNTARQLVNCTSTPPRTWPATKPTEETAPYRPMARVRSGPSGKLVVMRDSAAGATIAAPAPWMTRAAISSTGSWARPPARLARANATSPTMNIRRRPSRSAARPPRISRPPKEMA